MRETPDRNISTGLDIYTRRKKMTRGEKRIKRVMRRRNSKASDAA